ncbi:hypothetical protein ETD86_39160 [Nonomuraea turkmeniaca]|uniref:Uncharacterized protein n=1 Tax=Nonomuraea turkmeniaca TaxID=103838 RepID=A0A5S4FMX5_9ACTN|nr:hypothetical protein [Nonomuraea turkmeniaca]TMR10523.1 hypothetical protein ETD86_39160 [Nonomuraea turkmeniaca]
MDTPASADEPALADQKLTRVWSVLSHIVSPTAFIAALMVYFGALLANNTYRMLGLEPTLLGLSWQDYMLYSVILAEPLVIMLLVVLAALPAHTLLVHFLAGRRRITMGAAAVLAVLGIAGVATGVSLMASWLKLGGRAPVASICLGLGLFALGYAVSLHTTVHPYPRASPTTRIVQRTVFVALLALLLMWSLAELARIRASDFVQMLQQYPSLLHDAVVYAPRRLHLEGPGIVETPLPGENSMFRYRYSGLSLLIHTDEKYFLLPACWATMDRVRAISLPADDSLRLEFSQYTPLPDCPPVQ